MQYLNFLLLGWGNGAAYAGIAVALVVTYRSSGVINFAVASMSMYGAITFAELTHGNLFNPIPGLPVEVHLADQIPVLPALVIACAITALLSVLSYALVFRPLKEAHALSKVVASIGLMLFIQDVVGLRLGTNPVNVGHLFPGGAWSIGGALVPYDRVIMAGIVAALTGALWLLYRFTTFGLRTRAAAETEKGTVLVGLSPDRIAIYNWLLSGAIAGLAGIVVSPILSLGSGSFSLFIVPALAVALIGRFTSLGVALASGLALGMIQSELAFVQTKTWWPAVLGTSLGDVVPFAVIIVVLVVSGTELPGRGVILPTPLPEAPAPRRVGATSVVLVVAGVLGVIFLTGYRVALTDSMILAIVALSIVVVTGYTGQISLAQLTLAGFGAFFLVRFAVLWGIPFPWAPILVVVAVTVLGTLVGLPAVRVRGVQLGLLTLAAAVAADALYFGNLQLTGGSAPPSVGDPGVFGIDLGIGSGAAYPRLAFSLMVLVVLVGACLAMVGLRRSRLGFDMLAVRANERAAAAAGINVARTKLVAFAVGSALAGLAGTLMAYQSGQVSSDSFTALTGVLFFTVAYLSGVTSISGALVAGLLAPLGILAVFLDRTINFGDYYQLITAFFLMFAAVRHPEGIAGGVQSLARHWRAKRAGAAAPAEEPAIGAAGALAVPVGPKVGSQP